MFLPSSGLSSVPVQMSFGFWSLLPAKVSGGENRAVYLCSPVKSAGSDSSGPQLMAAALGAEGLQALPELDLEGLEDDLCVSWLV